MRFDGIVLPDRARLREAADDIRKGRGGISLYLSLLGLLAGFLAIGCIFLLGHSHTTNTSDLVPWGIQITTYVYFVLISTGCTFVNFFCHVFYEEDYKPFASRVIFLGIVTALAAFPRSSLGILFGPVGPRAYYYSALLPIYFIFIAFLTGSALCAVVAAVEWRKTPGDDSPLPAFFTTFLKIGLGLARLANFWRLMIGLAGHGPGWEVFRLTLFDSLFHGIFLAVVVPFLLSLFIRGPGGMIFTGLLILATQFKARSDLVAGGFKVPVFRAYDIPAVVQYTPSIFEVLVLIASVSLVSFLYLVCDRSGLFEPIPGKEA